MKITAVFYTPDEAAAAAGAVSRNVPDVLDIKISGGDKALTFYNSLLPAYNTWGNSPSYSPMAVPVPTQEKNVPANGKTTVRVVCRQHDYRSVSHIIVNKGGHCIEVSS